MLTRNTVNSGFRTTRYSFARLRAFMCAVSDNSSASAGSTSGASAARALLRSLIDLSSRACAELTRTRNAKMKESLWIMCLPVLHVALQSGRCNGKIRAKPLLRREFAKIRSHVWFEVEIQGGNATEEGCVNNRAPHDGVPKHVQCTESGCVHNDQNEDRHNKMTRVGFAPGKRVSNRSHQAANHRDERRRDVQPF